MVHEYIIKFIISCILFHMHMDCILATDKNGDVLKVYSHNNTGKLFTDLTSSPVVLV